jgi:hypothetical protein
VSIGYDNLISRKQTSNTTRAQIIQNLLIVKRQKLRGGNALTVPFAVGDNTAADAMALLFQK